jgi:aspartyl-tRNA(Asn)/glutamyl-tRNA(Gln) amidotransferase subunit A
VAFENVIFRSRSNVHDSIWGVSGMIRDGRLSPVALMRQCLERIEKLNPILNAFITVTTDLALATAKLAEQEIQRGAWRGPLHGVPIGLKDQIDTAGITTTAGSELFKDRVPGEDAEVVKRLKHAGAIIVGKNNQHEFAYGGSSIISYFGEVRNPWNPAHIAGGSSGGSAAAVAAGMCFAAIGTDTAGSVREPASQCGLVGLKPTYGRVSLQGVIPLSLSIDHVGPLTRTVADAAIVLQAIAKPGPSENGLPDFSARLKDGIAGMKLGIPRGFFFEQLDPEIAQATEAAIAVLARLGAVLCDVELDVPTDRTLSSAEAYSVHAENIARQSEKYHPDTLQRFLKGKDIPSGDIVNARRELAEVRVSIQSIFKHVDVLITPTIPIAPPAIDELKKNLDQLRPRELILLRNTRPANVWGIPAISVPCGFTSAGLPIGLQIMGAPWDEARVLQVAHAYEHATEWHKRQPTISA